MLNRNSNPPRTSDASRANRGFTLIELLMVMAIITIMTGIIAPRLVAFATGRKVNDAGRVVCAMARFSRSAAISEGRQYRLNVDTSTRSVWVTAQSGAEFLPVTNENGQHYVMPDGVGIETDFPQQPDGQYVVFDPSGLMEFSAAGNVQQNSTNQGSQPALMQSAKITLADRTNKTVTIACPSATEMFHIVQPGEVVP